MRIRILTYVICVLSSFSVHAQDYFVSAPYTSATMNTCGAGNDCGIRPTEDHEYQVTIPSAGNWTFSLCGSSYDTYIYIGTSLCSNNIGQNDDFCGLQSEVTANIAAGTYYVTVEGYSGCGSYTLDISGPPVALPEDDCAGALTINCGDVLSGNTSGYNADAVSFCGTSDGTGGGVWYKHTASCDNITASLCGSSFDTKLRIYSGSCGSLVCVGGNDDFCGLQSEVSWAATPGTDYYILVHGYGGSTGAYSLNLTCTSCCGTNPPTADFSVPSTVCENTSVAFTDISTCNATSWSWSFPGGSPSTSTAQNPTVTYPTSGTYSVTLTATNAYGSDVEVKTNYINVISCSGTCVGNYYYVRSNTTIPWSSTSNEQAMDAVFGAGVWTQGFFETVNPTNLFSASTCTIFMEGSDAGANELQTFLTANMALIESWVSTGGRLFINAAPNEGSGMSFGFSGTTLVYPNGLAGSSTAAAPSHDIFNGPFLPVGTNWTGNWFGHGNITNFGTSLIEGPSNEVLCSEKTIGAGLVVFGAMTTANWHSPSTEGQNLRQNILCYISPPTVCGPPTPLPVELAYWDGETIERENHLSWGTLSEYNSKFFIIQRSLDGIEFEDIHLEDAAGNSTELIEYQAIDENPFDAINYYRLKQIDVDGTTKYSDVKALDNRMAKEANLFPNPANSLVTITLDEKPKSTAKIVVRNMVGAPVIETFTNGKVQTLNVNELPNGVYFVEITSGDKSFIHKLNKI